VNAIRAWNHFWFGRISARPLGLLRILYGLVVIAHVSFLAYDAKPWLTDEGYLRGSEARELAGPWRPSPLQWVQDPLTVRLSLAAVGVLGALLALGWRTRIVSVLLYLGVLCIHNRLLLVASGADILLVCLAFYLMLSPCGAAYSLDARRIARKRGTLAEPVIIPWAQRLIQIQVAVVYFMTALCKAAGATWTDGTALYYVLNEPEFGRWTFGLSDSYILLSFLTYGALVLEFALPFLLWFKSSRPYAIAAGVALHVGIIFTINIPLFGEMMMLAYLSFVTPDELDAFGRLLNPLRWFGFARGEANVDLQGRRLDQPAPAAATPHFGTGRRRKPAATKPMAATSAAKETAASLANAVGR
jgi:hypothetical protein